MALLIAPGVRILLRPGSSLAMAPTSGPVTIYRPGSRSARVARRAGAPTFWLDARVGPRRTFPGDAGDVPDRMGGRPSGVRSNSSSGGGAAAAWAPGPAGTELDCSPAGATATFSDAGLPAGNSPWTIALDVRLAQISTVTSASLAYWGTWIDRSIFLIYEVSSGRLGLFGAMGPQFSGFALAAGVDYRVAAAYDGTAARLYVDGDLVHTTPPIAPGIIPGGTLWLGNDQFYEPAYAIFSQARIFDRALAPGDPDFVSSDWRLRARPAGLAARLASGVPVDPHAPGFRPFRGRRTLILGSGIY